LDVERVFRSNPVPGSLDAISESESLQVNHTFRLPQGPPDQRF
jgi:hypothetical protein